MQKNIWNIVFKSVDYFYTYQSSQHVLLDPQQGTVLEQCGDSHSFQRSPDESFQTGSLKECTPKSQFSQNQSQPQHNLKFEKVRVGGRECRSLLLKGIHWLSHSNIYLINTLTIFCKRIQKQMQCSHPIQKLAQKITPTFQIFLKTYKNYASCSWQCSQFLCVCLIVMSYGIITYSFPCKVHWAWLCVRKCGIINPTVSYYIIVILTEKRHFTKLHFEKPIHNEFIKC